VDRVSRFTLKNDQLASESVLIEIPRSRQYCCHNGGSLAFDNNGNLFISTGDNTQTQLRHAFDESNHKYSAEKSASNTNDLRGKILRIRPKQGGGYSIPEGNLFTENSLARPEIYIMGVRNPYKIFVDPISNTLFWGEVGPDDNQATEAGPAGHDEINRADSPGNYGWPYFTADNKPYRSIYDQSWYDPTAPYNRSRWNTGMAQLPKAQPAFHYVNHGAYMARFIYQYLPRHPNPHRLPPSYNNHLFYWNFNDGSIFAAKLTETENLERIVPLAHEVTKTTGIIDLAIGKDQSLYMLGYGAGCCPFSSDEGILARVDHHKSEGPPPEEGGYLNMPEYASLDLSNVPQTLSETGAFTDVKTLIPEPTLEPYTVNLPLWSDGAKKRRWLYLPDGKKIKFSVTEDWRLPGGSVMVKHFELTKRLETRLLVFNDTGSWYGVTYRWRADYSNADLVKKPIHESIKGQRWSYPDSKTCLECHRAGTTGVLGLNARQISHRTIVDWSKRGWFDGPIPSTTGPKLSQWSDPSASLTDKIKSYWDVNCRTCHRSGVGIAANWDASYLTPLGKANILENSGVDRKDYRRLYGMSDPKMIAPGDLSNSVIYHRSKDLDPSLRMPAVGSNVIDEDYLSHLKAWINHDAMIHPPAELESH